MKSVLLYCDLTGPDLYLHDPIQVGCLVMDQHFQETPLRSFSSWIRPNNPDIAVNDFLIRAGISGEESFRSRMASWPSQEEAMSGLSRVLKEAIPEGEDFLFCSWDAMLELPFLFHIFRESGVMSVSAETAPTRSLYNEMLSHSLLLQDSGKIVELPSRNLEDHLSQIRHPGKKNCALRKVGGLGKLFYRHQREVRSIYGGANKKRGFKKGSKAPILRPT